MYGNQGYRNFVVKALAFVVFVGGPVGGFYVMNEYRGVGYKGWTYLDTLDEPSFALSHTAHVPIWCVMYALYGIASYILWYTNGLVHSIGAYMISSVKFLFSLMWFPVFFYWEYIQGTFIISVVLWALNGLTMIFFAGMFQMCGLLLIPEQIWLSYILIWTFFLWDGESDTLTKAVRNQ